jgi:hypothetical protein
MFDVYFITFSGMTIPIAERLNKADMMEKVRLRNRIARERGQPVAKVGKGCWEHGEEDDNGMIGDRHGILKVKRARR